MPGKTIYFVGFGSQGSAWAQCLRSSAWDVRVYLAKSGNSWKLAESLGFECHLLNALPKCLEDHPGPHWVAMLCPDQLVAPIYGDYLRSITQELRLVLAHGFAVYSGDLLLESPRHRAALLAPKAIGPKLLQSFKNAAPKPHRLAAAFWAESRDAFELENLASGLGFSPSSLIQASFEQETIGDLISEQGLLCGGIFNLLDLTLIEMQKAGVPDALIREECLTELELVAGLIRERGPAQAFKAISQAAQCGTVTMGEKLENAGIRTLFEQQAQSVVDREFATVFRSSQWKVQAEKLADRLSSWEKRFKSLEAKE